MGEPRTPQQERALQHAWDTRSARASLKRGLMRRSLDPVEILRGNDETWEPWMQTLRLDTFLSFIHGFGEVTVKQALEELRIPGHITFAGMTFAQRDEVARMVHLAVYGIPAAPQIKEAPHA